MLSVSQITKEARKLGDSTRTEEPTEGLENWTNFAKMHSLGKNDLTIGDWKPQTEKKEIYNGNNHEIEHFINQVSRLTHETTPNLCRLAQLFYNLGQLEAVGLGHHYSLDIDTYITLN